MLYHIQIFIQIQNLHENVMSFFFNRFASIVISHHEQNINCNFYRTATRRLRLKQKGIIVVLCKNKFTKYFVIQIVPAIHFLVIYILLYNLILHIGLSHMRHYHK